MIKTPLEYAELLHKMVVSTDKNIHGGTIEQINAQYTFTDGMDNLPFLNKGYASTVWDTMLDQALGYTPKFSSVNQLNSVKEANMGWFDEPTTLDYGAAFCAVFDCADKLKWDATSRRATIRLRGSSCLMSVQFLIRNPNTIHTIATFRSLDLVKGLPVDLFVLQRLTDVVINRLNKPTSLDRILTVNAGSAHIYLNDIERVEEAWENLQDIATI